MRPTEGPLCFGALIRDALSHDLRYMRTAAQAEVPGRSLTQPLPLGPLALCWRPSEAPPTGGATPRPPPGQRAPARGEGARPHPLRAQVPGKGAPHRWGPVRVPEASGRLMPLPHPMRRGAPRSCTANGIECVGRLTAARAAPGVPGGVPPRPRPRAQPRGRSGGVGCLLCARAIAQGRGTCPKSPRPKNIFPLIKIEMRWKGQVWVLVYGPPWGGGGGLIW